MKTRTQNFDVPLNSSSVPSQMFALSEGQTYFRDLLSTDLRVVEKRKPAVTERGGP